MNKAYCKDIMHWEEFPKYDIIWCDPPWGQSMVKYFETLMAKEYLIRPNHTIEDIIDKLASLAIIGKPVFIEYSIKDHDMIVLTMKKYGHIFDGITYTTQENGKPYCILCFNTYGYFPLGKYKGFEIINHVCDTFRFNSVFDPFAGIGKTAKYFIKNGKQYIGSEINPSRFKKLQKILWDAQQ